jgi:hypothetical protein
MKVHYDWTDTKVSEMCGYKSRESFLRSLYSAKKFPIQGMIIVFEMENGFNDKAVFVYVR